MSALTIQPQRSTRLRAVSHHGPCSDVRIDCPAHGKALGPNYRPSEVFAGGRVVSHDCGATFAPYEALELVRARYWKAAAARDAAFAEMESASKAIDVLLWSQSHG